MQFHLIGHWLIDGRSPNTGQPVTETRRRVKPGQELWMTLGRVTGETQDIYKVGKTYAIQPGRGQKAIGRTLPVVAIERQDVRDMTEAQAVASGYATVLDYLLLAWTPMHDESAFTHAELDLDWRLYRGFQNPASWQVDHGAAWLAYLRERPAERYDAWVIRFAPPRKAG